MQIVDQIEAGKIVLTLTGPMDFLARTSFHQAIEQAKRSQPLEIILDFSHVPFINSAGLGLLMIAHKDLTESKIRLSLEVPEGAVSEVFTLTNMGQKVPISICDSQPTSSAPQRLPSSSKMVQAPPPIFESSELEELLLPILERLERKDFSLPVFPQVAHQVLQFTTDPEAHASKLLTLLQMDPILTGKILKTANSAAWGTSRGIESLSQAVAWLGVNSVAGTAFALSVQSGVFNDRGYEQEVKALWAHAIATGFYAKTLSGIIGKNPDTAFLCGLLHSIGKPFVVHAVNEYCPSSASPIPWSMIKKLIDQSYIEVGRQLADAWSFPPAVKEAIHLHQHQGYQLAMDPSKGAALTCLGRHFATYHLDSLEMSEETLRALPVTNALNIPSDVLNGSFEIKETIQTQIDSLLIDNHTDDLFVNVLWSLGAKRMVNGCLRCPTLSTHGGVP